MLPARFAFLAFAVGTLPCAAFAYEHFLTVAAHEQCDVVECSFGIASVGAKNMTDTFRPRQRTHQDVVSHENVERYRNECNRVSQRMDALIDEMRQKYKLIGGKVTDPAGASEFNHRVQTTIDEMYSEMTEVMAGIKAGQSCPNIPVVVHRPPPNQRPSVEAHRNLPVRAQPRMAQEPHGEPAPTPHHVFHPYEPHEHPALPGHLHPHNQNTPGPAQPKSETVPAQKNES